jgi:peptidyl-prolyl cis-trans isomerase A (cyclophilin A)
MKKIIIFLLLFIVAPKLWAQRVQCEIKTSEGNILIEVYTKRAPVTAANFLSYVDAHLFDSSAFYRTVTLQNQPDNKIKIEVIQGGLLDSLKERKPISHENTRLTGIKHKNGVISMARADTGTATAHFFICIHNQPALDYGGKRNPDGQGFAAFGRVIKGMRVVRKIQSAPHQHQQITPPVIIYTIRRVER